MEKPGASHAFESAFMHSTSNSIDLNKLDQIKEIPCLILWGQNDKLMPSKHMYKFKETLKDAKTVLINNAGHAPFIEKPFIVYEK